MEENKKRREVFLCAGALGRHTRMFVWSRKGAINRTLSVLLIDILYMRPLSLKICFQQKFYNRGTSFPSLTTVGGAQLLDKSAREIEQLSFICVVNLPSAVKLLRHRAYVTQHGRVSKNSNGSSCSTTSKRRGRDRRDFKISQL